MTPMLNKHKIRNVKALITEWAQLTDRWDRARSKEFRQDAAHLFHNLSDWKRKRESRNLKIAEDWNLFRIIRVGHLETRLHTPFLRALMDSNGSHGQGTLFFTKFLEQLARLPGGPAPGDLLFYVPDRFQGDYACIEEVFDREAGRMDLVIERRFGLKAFCIIIENKIRALEQPKQLQRYLSYLKKHPAPRNRRFLVYLHAFGNEHRPKSGKNCLVVRYQNEIRNMLRESYPHVRAQTVRDTIRQYLAVIDDL